MAERPLSKKKRGRKSDENSAVMPPNMGPTIRAQAGVNGGTEIPSTVENIESSTPHEFPHENLTRHEIKDRLAHGGVSMLERQHILATDVYMSDEDRAAYRDDPKLPRLNTEQSATSRPPSNNSQLGSTKARALEEVGSPQARPPKASIERMPPPPHLERIKATPRAPGFGAEGALAPQGIMSPKGLLMSYGLMGPKGLLAPRSDRPQALRSTSFNPVGSKNSSNQASTSFKAQKLPQALHKPTVQGANNSHPRTSPPASRHSPNQAPTPSPASSVFKPVTTAESAQFSPSQTANYGQQTQSHFQAVDTPIQNWFAKKGPSPIEEIFSKIFKLIGALFGIGGDKSEGGKKPHLRGGH